MDGHDYAALPSLLTGDSWLILAAVDHNLNFYIFKCFEYAQWCVNAKECCFISTALSTIHAQLNQSMIIYLDTRALRTVRNKSEQLKQQFS